MEIAQLHLDTEFEWDEAKRLKVLAEREIDFKQAARSLLTPHLEKRSDRGHETRILALCELSSELVAIIYTMRDGKCRIITARAARRNERREHRQIFR